MSINGISVIIPNYNGRALLEQILPSAVDALNNAAVLYEIIVVDDCSTDDSVHYLHRWLTPIIVLQNAENMGFSVTANKGIFLAKHSHLLILNSDVKLDKNYFASLFRYFDKPDTFGVMGRLTGWDNDVIQDGGKYPFFHGVKIKTSGNYIPLNAAPDSWLYSMYLSGANAFVDREKMLQLKGFDEIFSPYYVEDYELSLRAWRLGWKCYYEHFAVCRHRTSSTISSTQRKNAVAVIYNRNKMYLHAIHLEGAVKILWYLQLLFEALISLITAKWYYLKALSLFIKSQKRLSSSVQAFKILSLRQGTKKSVKEVAAGVKNSLAAIPIKRF